MTEQNAPIVFARAGVIGAEPPGFYEAVAKKYDALYRPVEYFSPDSADQTPYPFAPGDDADDWAKQTVETGKNIFFDGFLNTAEQRDRLCRLRELGAHAAVLVVSANMDETIAHLNDYHDQLLSRLDTPDNLDLVAAIEAAKQMWEKNQTLDWLPGPDEQRLLLDGSQSTELLLDEVAEWVVRNGWAERD